MTQTRHFLRSTILLVALIATWLLIAQIAHRFYPNGPAEWVAPWLILVLTGLWTADLIRTQRKVRYRCRGCKKLSAKIVKKKVKHGYFNEFWECEQCGHSEEAKD